MIRVVVTWTDDGGKRRRYRLDALTAKDAEREARDLILNMQAPPAGATVEQPFRLLGRLDAGHDLDARVHEAGAAGRLVVLSGAGKSFSAGADLNWMKRMAGYTREQNVEDATALARMLEALFRFPKPTIARIRGACVGGGATVVRDFLSARLVDHMQLPGLLEDIGELLRLGRNIQYLAKRDCADAKGS